jgi:carbonic anhydrase
LRKSQGEVFPAKRELLERLSRGQKPHTLFIGCSDSRVAPELFTQTEPGELFVIRNAGNIVPPYTQPSGGVTAGIEFAVAALGVRHIVVCGHSDCGAMKGLLHPERLTAMPAVASWLQQAEATRQVVQETCPGLDETQTIRALTRRNVLVQLHNIRTHPSVAAGLAVGKLHLYGYVYDIACRQVDAFDPEEQTYAPLNGEFAANQVAQPNTFRSSG